GIKDYYESYHRVQLPDDILQQAVSLSERYITDRFLPDKAIDLLDEACAHAALRNKEGAEYDQASRRLEELRAQEETMEQDPELTDYEALAQIRAESIQLSSRIEELAPIALHNEVTRGDLAEVIELWTGIPASKVRQEEIQQLAHLEEQLKQHIIGQDEAVQLVSAAIRRSRMQISARRRPASFIFVGPTGVGKTELVKVLSQELFHTPETLIRLDMSEFMEKHSVSRIIGSPPGYVGYDEAGQLTEKVRRKPYSVLLFDEIEKAHPDVLNILLQILDEGRITDAHGRRVNFENTVVVMTSNAGSQKQDTLLGFGRTADDASREKAMKALREFLRPEFLSRVDDVVVFHHLTKEHLVRIAGLMLTELKDSLKEKNLSLSWDEEAAGVLAQKADGGKSGARDMHNIIRREVEDRIASLLIDQCDNPPTVLKLTGADGALQLLSL
ncbi:MAG: ATP-dependent Clp protease ATP-binding subunit, partial [Clostridiales bacterium]|nr:ATP-dependent Clp protease ATP-binding subunit [Clostridiales bacterium]